MEHAVLTTTERWLTHALGGQRRYDPPAPARPGVLPDTASGAPAMTASSPAVPPVLMVVDDEPELRALLSEYFGRQGFTVHAAADSAAARGLLAGGVMPQVALLDVNMPGENGLSLARWLREAHPRVAVMMLTTAGEAVDRIVGLEMGADDYIPKPFEMREVLARVRAVLRRTLAEPAPAAAAATAAAALA
ncbi:MAG: response regulator transcription factor, partial [Aquabacterium sp.]